MGMTSTGSPHFGAFSGPLCRGHLLVAPSCPSHKSAGLGILDRKQFVEGSLPPGKATTCKWESTWDTTTVPCLRASIGCRTKPKEILERSLQHQGFLVCELAVCITCPRTPFLPAALRPAPTRERHGRAEGRQACRQAGMQTGSPGQTVHVYIYIHRRMRLHTSIHHMVYTSRFVRVVLAQGPCQSSLHRSKFNG